DVFSDAVREELLLGVAAHVGVRQHRDRRLVGERQWLWRGWQPSLDGCGIVANPVGPHWPGNVLRLLLAEILEGGIQPIAYLVANNPANTDPPGFGQRLQPRRYVHTVAEDVLFLDDHVAKVNADAKPDLPLLG